MLSVVRNDLGRLLPGVRSTESVVHHFSKQWSSIHLLKSLLRNARVIAENKVAHLLWLTVYMLSMYNIQYNT